MNRRDAIGAVGADDGEVGHAYLLSRPFFNQAHADHEVVVSRMAGTDVIEEPAIDLVDNLELARKGGLKKFDGPAFEGLGKQGVIGVGERPHG